MLSTVKVMEAGRELDSVRELFREYANELNVDLCFQGFDTELKDPLKKYGPPRGSLFISYWNKEPAGCIALQPIEKESACEMKRLYIKPMYRRFGIGGELVKVLLQNAAELGYNKMVLDTLKRLQPAIRLYEQHGFKPTSAYYSNPLSDVVYMEREL